MEKKKLLDIIKSNKRLMAIILSTTIGVSTMSACSEQSKITAEDAGSGLIFHRFLVGEYGTVDGEAQPDDFSEALQATRDYLTKNNNSKNSFVFVKISDYNFDTDYIKSLLGEGKNVGLIIEPYDATYSKIYDTVDYIKEIITENEIKCPIFYDVSKYMDSDYIEANCKLGNEFCEKLSSNGCYVGFYGSESDLEKYNSYFNIYLKKSISAYDKMTKISYDTLNELVERNENKHGTLKEYGNLIELPDGTVLSKCKLETYIEEFNLNVSDNFQDDQVYIVKSGDNLTDIAKKYNFKDNHGYRYDVLGQFNGCEDGNLQAGDPIVIPNSYEVGPIYKVVDGEITYGYYDKKHELRGIDVSDYQDIIDWETVQNQIDFAIIKVRDFAADDIDAKFEYNISECNRLGIPVGVYYFPRATTEEDEQREVEYIIEKLKGYKIDLPVYMDIEDPELVRLMKKNGYGVKKFKEIINIAFTTLKANGYTVGLYGDMDKMTNILDMDCEFMFVNHETYDDIIKTSDLKSHLAENQYICQHTQKGSVEGIEGDVDLDHCPYSYYLKFSNEDNQKIKVYS